MTKTEALQQASKEMPGSKTMFEHRDLDIIHRGMDIYAEDKCMRQKEICSIQVTPIDDIYSVLHPEKVLTAPSPNFD